MKRILFAATMLGFFVSCNDATKTETTSSTAEKNLEANRKVFKAIETGDRAMLDSFIAKDAVDHQGPNGDIKGDDSVRIMLADMHNHVKDMKMEIISSAANDDYIFTLSTFSGTVTDNFMGMPAGASINERGVDVVKVKDGKMMEHWNFVDPAAMMKNMQAMGEHKMDNMVPKDSAKK